MNIRGFHIVMVYQKVNNDTYCDLYSRCKYINHDDCIETITDHYDRFILDSSRRMKLDTIIHYSTYDFAGDWDKSIRKVRFKLEFDCPYLRSKESFGKIRPNRLLHIRRWTNNDGKDDTLVDEISEDEIELNMTTIMQTDIDETFIIPPGFEGIPMATPRANDLKGKEDKQNNVDEKEEEESSIREENKKLIGQRNGDKKKRRKQKQKKKNNVHTDEKKLNDKQKTGKTCNVEDECEVMKKRDDNPHDKCADVVGRKTWIESKGNESNREKHATQEGFMSNNKETKNDHVEEYDMKDGGRDGENDYISYDEIDGIDLPKKIIDRIKILESIGYLHSRFKIIDKRYLIYEKPFANAYGDCLVDDEEVIRIIPDSEHARWWSTRLNYVEMRFVLGL
jgi:hypothetical protein